MWCLLTFVLSFLAFLKLVAVLTCGRVKSHACLLGKTALITGGNRGIGYETCLALAARGCRIIIADKDDAEDSKRKIIEETGNPNVVTKRFDLTSFKSIRRFAEDILKSEKRLDILINNAGIGRTQMAETEDGNYAITQINHLGGFLLTHLLVGLLRKTPSSRVVFVSSLLAFTNNLTVDNMNRKQETAVFDYGNTKLCNIISAKVLGEILQGEGIAVNSVHPGAVRTTIFSFETSSALETAYMMLAKVLIFLYGKSPEEGAQSSIHAAIGKECGETSGKLYVDCKKFFLPSKACDEAFCRQIFKKSEVLCKLQEQEKLSKQLL